jgi:flavin reductase (DIM6/NTAB) family NADH-FMN oxidoreductase RutF
MKRVESDLGAGIGALPSFPVVLVTVRDNILTAAAFHFYSFEPPSVMVGIVPNRYTYQLIMQENEFGINIPTVDQLDVVRICGSVSGRDENKYVRAGITPFRGKAIRSLMIAECPVNIECRVVHRVAYKGTHDWFVGEIVAVHVEEGYARDEALMFWAGDYRGVGPVLPRPI